MWPLLLVLYLMIGLVLAIYPFIESARRYGLVGAAAIWPYLLYKKFKE